ncbi:glycosyltransferase [Bacillus sp. NTK071]|uniref:glycosyltransferase family 2 protein n=1 Tax=Bacillus sp. NTK071 TaxID=2802175 RepID=UPI001A8CA311|nr:glycosyltransferase [Bacillus sp. NTK071]MBN8211149.1 glycosyltransferase [Bacillus sp. NTK071]
MNQNKRVLIGCPVHQKPHILELFLTSLSRLSTQNIEISFLFIDDNVDVESINLLSEFNHQTGNVRIVSSHTKDNYHRNDITHQWSEQLVWKVADFKNQIIETARKDKYDYLFLIDSDLLIHPETIQNLIKANKNIISEVFWTKWQPESSPQPQVWMTDEYNQWHQKRGENLSDEEVQRRYSEFIKMMKEPGIYQVGGLGACTLISAAALVSGVNFNPIYNLTFWGEDRHFCIRAASLGFSLYVDTHTPAFHIYRESDIEEGINFLQETKRSPTVEKQVQFAKRNLPSITLSMIVRNESDKYLRKVLQEHAHYIDQAVIIDDGSTDDTVQVCLDTLKDVKVHMIENQTSKFLNEVELRKQQWKETIKVEPDWILNLDADEIFESRFKNEVHNLLENNTSDVISFRLFDFWNESHYREDFYWNAHLTYRPFLMKYRKDLNVTWKETTVHCGRFPDNIFSLPNSISNLRLKHLGWMKVKDRIEKFNRYMEHDPEGKYGSFDHYLSILDEHPNLVEWKE